MNKLTSTFTLLLLIETVFVVDGHAMRAAHRPWLAKDFDDSTPIVRVKPEPSRKHLRHSVFHMTGGGAKGDKIAHQAIQYKGTKYRFGGDSKAHGFDCSGLVRRVYNDLHLDKVPHSAVGMYRMGHPVRTSELRPGDLVFFKNTYRKGISHVGVYAGDNHFIHAQNRRHGVTVTLLSEPYYQLHYAGARRLY
jgi:cell wall-associated NlpC family hydrolase